MRSAFLGTGLLVLVTTACGPKAPAAQAPAPDAPTAPHSAAEEAARYARANALRAQLLAWSQFERPPQDAPCDPGTLRTFQADSGKTYAKADSAIRELERTIVAFGIDQPVDVPAGHALLRTVLAWEAGEERPRWDVAAGQEAPRTIPTGLTGDFYNMETKQCEPLSAVDTITVVMPKLEKFEAPKSFRTAAVQLLRGDSAIYPARDAFFAAHARDTAATFIYTKVQAVVLWRDYAVVAVNRPALRQAIVELQKGAGGATYVFRREKNEWRLLVIARTWS